MKYRNSTIILKLIINTNLQGMCNLNTNQFGYEIKYLFIVAIYYNKKKNLKKSCHILMP